MLQLLKLTVATLKKQVATSQIDCCNCNVKKNMLQLLKLTVATLKKNMLQHLKSIVAT
jgi:hypothetical protein